MKKSKKPLIVKVPKKIVYKSKPLNLQFEGFSFPGHHINRGNHPNIFEAAEKWEQADKEFQEQKSELGAFVSHFKREDFYRFGFHAITAVDHYNDVNKTPLPDAINFVSFLSCPLNYDGWELDIERDRRGFWARFIYDWFEFFWYDDVRQSINQINLAIQWYEFNYQGEFDPVFDNIRVALSQAALLYQKVEDLDNVRFDNKEIIRKELLQYIDKGSDESHPAQVSDKLTVEVGYLFQDEKAA